MAPTRERRVFRLRIPPEGDRPRKTSHRTRDFSSRASLSCHLVLPRLVWRPTGGTRVAGHLNLAPRNDGKVGTQLAPPTGVTSKERWALAAAIALVAALAAQATMRLSGLPLYQLHEFVPQTADDDLPRHLASGPSESASPGVAAIASATRATIGQRNIFCPSCQGATVAVGPTADPLAARTDGEIRSALNLRLVGTMESTQASASVATVYDADTGTIGLYGEFDLIRPHVIVTRIEQGIVHIRNAARSEFLVFGAPLPPISKPRPAPRKPSAADAAIECPSEDLCILERAFVESLLSNPMALGKQARFAPNQHNGKTRGYAIHGIRRGTIPRLLGLKNGDIMTAINGTPLTSIDGLMALYTKLRHTQRLQIDFLRKGLPHTKEIQIR